MTFLIFMICSTTRAHRYYSKSPISPYKDFDIQLSLMKKRRMANGSDKKGIIQH